MNRLLDWLSDYLSKRGGLLPLIGLAFIVINLFLQVYPGPGSVWFVESNLLLHIGLIIAIIGILLLRVLQE